MDKTTSDNRRIGQTNNGQRHPLSSNGHRDHPQTTELAILVSPYPTGQVFDLNQISALAYQSPTLTFNIAKVLPTVAIQIQPPKQTRILHNTAPSWRRFARRLTHLP